MSETRKMQKPGNKGAKPFDALVCRSESAGTNASGCGWYTPRGYCWFDCLEIEVRSHLPHASGTKSCWIME